MKYQELFNYLHKEHNLILVESELEEIIRIAKKPTLSIDIDKSYIGRRLRLLKVSDELIERYLKYRKREKQNDTEKSFNRLFSDIDLNVVDLSEVLELIMEMNWKSFSMSFIKERDGNIKKQYASVLKKQEQKQTTQSKRLYI